jgi:hypothetical protein
MSLHRGACIRLAALLPLTLAGCDTPTDVQVAALDHRAVQPLEVRPAPPRVDEPPRTVEPEHLDPLLEHNVGARVAPAGLVEPTRSLRPDWVVVEPADLSTAIDQAQPAVVFGPASPLFQQCAEDPRCIRLVTYPEGEVVPTTRHLPEPGYGDISRRVTLVPEAALTARWYAVELMLDAEVAESARVAGVQVARFRPDSHPVLTHALVGSREGRGVLELRFSERVAGDVPASRWSLSDGRGPLPCETLGPAPGREEHHAVFVCDRELDGIVRVELGGPLRTIPGTVLTDGEGNALTATELPMPPTMLGVARISVLHI